MAKTRDTQREKYWRRVFERQARSGMTALQFCESEDLKPSTYHFWRQEIRRRDAEAASPKQDAGLVPLQVVGSIGDSAPVEVVVNGDLVVRVGEAASAEHLRRVLQVVVELD